jgi:hypothetical protein
LGVKKAKIKLQSPKTELELQNINLGPPNIDEENFDYRGQKAKKSLQSPKTEFGAQNHYGRVTYPSIGNFTWSKKIYTFRGQKGKNNASES